MFLFQLKDSICFVLPQKVFVDTRYQYRGETIIQECAKIKKKDFLLTLYSDQHKLKKGAQIQI